MLFNSVEQIINDVYHTRNDKRHIPNLNGVCARLDFFREADFHPDVFAFWHKDQNLAQGQRTCGGNPVVENSLFILQSVSNLSVSRIFRSVSRIFRNSTFILIFNFTALLLR